MPKNDDQAFSVIRDYTVSREFLDQVRAVLPACVHCNKPSGYVDMDGRPSHMVCSGESSEAKREAKIKSRNGKVARNAGALDLALVMRQAEENAVTVTDQRTFEQRRADTMRHINRGRPPGPRAPELISRMSEREIYDLRDVRVSLDRGGDRELIDRARRAVDLGYFPVDGRDQERIQDHVDHLLRRQSSRDWQSGELARKILITGSPSYQQAFAKVMIAGLRGSPDFAGLSTEEMKLINRAMTTGAGTQGGFAVPFQLDPTIVPTSDSNINPIRAIARQVSITSNEWRQPTSAAMSASYVAEGAVATDVSPTLSQPTFIPKRVQAFAPVSYELAEDWDGLLDSLGSLIQEAKDDLEAVQFTTGVGTTVFPTGILVAGTASSRALDLAGLYLTELELPPRWRKRAVWMGNRLKFQDIRKLPLPESSAPVFDHVPGGATEILGYPAVENSAMTTATGSGSKVLGFGDPTDYVICDRIGLDVEATSYHFQQTIFGAGSSVPVGQKGILGLWRNTANLLAATSWRIYTIP